MTGKPEILTDANKVQIVTASRARKGVTLGRRGESTHTMRYNTASFKGGEKGGSQIKRVGTTTSEDKAAGHSGRDSPAARKLRGAATDAHGVETRNPGPNTGGKVGGVRNKGKARWD